MFHAPSATAQTMLNELIFFVSQYLNFDRDEQSQLGKGKGWLNSDKRVKVTYGFTTIQYQIPSMKLKNEDYLIFKKKLFLWIPS